MKGLQGELLKITQYFELGEIESFTRAGGVANENYFVNTHIGRYVIKIIREHSASSIKSELPYFQRLKEYEFPTTFYLHSPSGESLLELDELTAVAMDRVDGIAPTVSLATNHNLGCVLARLHNIPTTGLTSRLSWLNADFIPQSIDELAQALPPKDLQPYRDAFKGLARLRSLDHKHSIIHGDFFPDNCLFKQGELVSVIDWEEVSLGSPLLDLARTILSVCFKNYKFDVDLFAALLGGYEGIRPLSLNDQEYLGDSIRSVGLTFSLWVYLRYGIGNDDPNLIKARRMYWEYNLNSWLAPIVNA